ncbi:MAG: hypothetical protein IIV61_09135, partial [Oscillospiraceae bacterium]|nr:hypothetical protein [Oscillospiraceae bacterium]
NEGGKFAALGAATARACPRPTDGTATDGADRDGKGRRGDRLGRSCTLPARLGAVHLPSREGMRRLWGGDSRSVRGAT